jgi:hypothetical protein
VASVAGDAIGDNHTTRILADLRRARRLEQVHSRECQAYSRLDISVGMRRMHRANIQGLVISSSHTPGWGDRNESADVAF